MSEHESRIERWRSLPEDRRALLMQLLKERAGRPPHLQAIPRTKHDGVAPQSFAQQRLWYLDQINPGDASYNMPECARLTGDLDIQVVRKCFNEIVKRHEILRTTFDRRDGRPVQVISPSLVIDVELIDLAGLPASEREAEARRLLFVHSEFPFDLSRGPLAALTLFRLADQEHFLLLNLHHIISDGWSTGVFVREFTTLYEAAVEGRSLTLPELPIQYADYSIWQQGWLESESLQRQIDYWTTKLAGVPDIKLPISRARPAVRKLTGGFQSIMTSKQLFRDLLELGLKENATLFMVLAAAFKTLLHRYTGQTDISIGTPIAGRNRPELEPLIGLLANTLVLRTDLSQDPSFRTALSRVKKIAEEAYVNQDAPFERLVEKIQPERSLSRNPLFQVMFILQNTPMPPLALPRLKFELLAAGTLSVKFDILFELYETPQGLQGWMGYSVDLFDDQVMERFAARYLNWLQTVVDKPDEPISSLPCADSEELDRLIDDFNAPL